MKIIEVPISELKPYENNPRRNDQAVEAVAASIREFGFKVPIVIDANRQIVCGHTRYKAAKKLELETIPCVEATDLTDEQIRAFRLADNKTAELAGWDFEKLHTELETLDFDMHQFGFRELQEIKIDEIFETSEEEPTDSEPEKEDENKTVTCPHCGMEFVP